MANICSKCKKDIGNYFTGEWRSVKGQKYCLVCANKLEIKKEEVPIGHRKDDVCVECNKALGGFFGKWKYHKGKKYCLDCAKKTVCKDLDKGKTTSKSRKEYSEETCLECGKPLSWYNTFSLNTYEIAIFEQMFKLKENQSYPHFCSAITCKSKWVSREMGNPLDGWRHKQDREKVDDDKENKDNQEETDHILNSKIKNSTKRTKPLLEFKGRNGKIELYEHFVRLDRGTMMGFLMQGLKGKKDIYFRNITSIQIKKPGLAVGYLQFSIPGGKESKGGVMAAVSDENTITFTGSDKYAIALKIKEYIENSSHQLPTKPHISIASEIEKIAELRDKGILTESEFKEKKKELLGRL